MRVWSNRQIARVMAVAVFALARVVCADSAPATQPAYRGKTGEIDLTFTERSPLSSTKELARRLVLIASSLKDYDLSKCPFKAYIPTNYDPSIPHGLFVYLGYKNTGETPPLWQPLFEKYHLIFISPVCHSGDEYLPSVPFWQTMGLALDAVENCKKQYNIDPHRIYLMTWSKNALRTSFATADVFDGFIVTLDTGYVAKIVLPGGSYYPAQFSAPPGDIMTYARQRAYFLINDGQPANVQPVARIVSAMKHDNFAAVMTVTLSPTNDLHYPVMKAEWFEQKALPLLDKTPSAPLQVVDSSPATPVPATRPAATAPAVSEPQHLLTLAQLYISNGQTDLAQKKLQEIIDDFPNDPAAATAKDMLAKLNQ